MLQYQSPQTKDEYNRLLDEIILRAFAHWQRGKARIADPAVALVEFEWSQACVAGVIELMERHCKEPLDIRRDFPDADLVALERELAAIIPDLRQLIATMVNRGELHHA